MLCVTKQATGRLRTVRVPQDANTDIEKIPQSNFELSKDFLNLKSYITKISFACCMSVITTNCSDVLIVSICFQNQHQLMNESEYCMSLNRPRAAEGRIECHKMHTTDIQIMPQNKYELRDSLLNVISYTRITIPAFPRFMPRNTAADVCDSRYSKIPEKS